MALKGNEGTSKISYDECKKILFYFHLEMTFFIAKLILGNTKFMRQCTMIIHQRYIKLGGPESRYIYAIYKPVEKLYFFQILCSVAKIFIYKSYLEKQTHSTHNEIKLDNIYQIILWTLTFNPEYRQKITNKKVYIQNVKSSLSLILMN